MTANIFEVIFSFIQFFFSTSHTAIPNHVAVIIFELKPIIKWKDDPTFLLDLLIKAN